MGLQVSVPGPHIGRPHPGTRRFSTPTRGQFTNEELTGSYMGLIRISMDGRGRALDNAMVERLGHSVKYEVIYLREYTVGKVSWQRQS